MGVIRKTDRGAFAGAASVVALGCGLALAMGGVVQSQPAPSPAPQPAVMPVASPVLREDQVQLLMKALAEAESHGFAPTEFNRPELQTLLASRDPSERQRGVVLLMRQAVAYAKASRPNVLEAVFVDVDGTRTSKLVDEWDRARIDVPLKQLYSPYREITRPIVEYARELRAHNPRGVVAVYIPEYVVGHWWEQALHNQSALRLKARLHFVPGVMIASVPWQLSSSDSIRQEIREEGYGVHDPAAAGGTGQRVTSSVTR